jgi:hypothetical protein
MVKLCTICFNNQQFCILHRLVSYNSHKKTVIISLNSVNQLIFVMVKCCVFFAVRTEFLNII